MDTKNPCWKGVNVQFNKIAQMAWKGLASNKLRSLLTMLGVIIGVAAVIVMIAISAGAEKTIEEQITKLGSNQIYLQSQFMRGGPGAPASGGLVFGDAAAILADVSGVAGTVVEQDSNVTVKYGAKTLTDIEIVGTTADFATVRDMTIADGRMYNQNDVDRKQKVIVLGSSLAQQLFGSSSPIGEALTVGQYKLIVIGVFASKGTVGNTDYDSRLYTPITVVFQKYTPSFFARMIGDRVRMITVKLEDDANPADVIEQINHVLARRHKVSLDNLDFQVLTQKDVIQSREATTAAFRSLLAWVAGVSLIVGGIGIMNIMLVSVTERTREIGIRQAVGATPNDIRLQFLAEALLLSLVGGTIGVIVGVSGSWLFGILGSMRTVIVPESIVLAFASSAAVGIFFGYYPANTAAQLDPIQALRHE
jgi:putative ABC transport system permease protein